MIEFATNGYGGGEELNYWKLWLSQIISHP